MYQNKACGWSDVMKQELPKPEVYTQVPNTDPQTPVRGETNNISEGS